MNVESIPNMQKIIIFPLVALVALLSSCINSYHVAGSSSLPDIDGRMLYLKEYVENNIKNIDSCNVLHGQFNFSGTLDTIKMANLYVGEQYVMPLVLEDGTIRISLTAAQHKVSGTPMNDELYKYLNKRVQLENQLEELSHQETQAIMNGENIEKMREKLFAQAQRLQAELDDLETSFIVNNSDNILGPQIFKTLCSTMSYPILTPQIEEIMSRATQKFKNDSFVSEFYRTASNNMHLMQGYDRQDLDNFPSK